MNDLKTIIYLNEKMAKRMREIKQEMCIEARKTAFDLRMASEAVLREVSKNR